MVTGVNPFSVNAKSFGEVLVRHLTFKPPRPEDIADAAIRLPKQFEVLILKCLEKEPYKRPQSIDEVQEQLRQIADEESLQLESYLSLALAKPRYLGKVVSISVATMVLVGGVLGVKMWPSSKRHVLRPSVSAPAYLQPSPRTEMALRGFAGGKAEANSETLFQEAKPSQAAVDPTLVPATLSENRVAPRVTSDSRSGGDTSANKPVLRGADTPLLASGTQPEPVDKNTSGAQTRRKHRSSNSFATKSKPGPSRLDTRATVDPFAEE
jgi:hypothetical protein